MELNPMQYKGFVWPHNPRTYNIRYRRNVAVHKVPFGRYAMQDLGLTRRVMWGEGEFYGPQAYEQFKKLASVFYAGGPGTLIHPVWQSTNVYFVGLSLAQEPRKDYVRYTFTFWEDYDGYQDSLTPYRKPQVEVQENVQSQESGDGVYHTVIQGETLWSISRAYGLTLGEMMTRNPQIKNPNVVQAGQKLRVG